MATSFPLNAAAVDHCLDHPNGKFSTKRLEPSSSSWNKYDRHIYPSAAAIPNYNYEAPTRRSCYSVSRPSSSQVGLPPSTIIYGRKFENICYFFLQLVFTMGFLIGLSLCIAGIILRKSVARNLQVLVYIGALLLLVCGLLIVIQWQNRSKRRKSITAMKNVNFNRQQQQIVDLDVVNVEQQPVQGLPHVPITLYQNPLNKDGEIERIQSFRRTMRNSTDDIIIL